MKNNQSKEFLKTEKVSLDYSNSSRCLEIFEKQKEEKFEVLEKLKKSYLPMSEASFLVLSSLRKESHGYGIMQEVSRNTGGRVVLGAGTVYTILYKMERDKLITVMREEDRRKIYLITSMGESILEEEAKRIKQLAHIADRVLNKSM